MDKREYLRSLGFEVGKRGRFSAEMLKALEGFDEGTESKIDTFGELLNQPLNEDGSLPGTMKFEINGPIPKSRTDGVSIYTLTTKTGLTIRFDTCPDCKENIKFCHCSSPQPPKWLADEVASWQTV